jgi:D-glycero-D-manno-heptose 1,7-bisphosphate phosphatase
MFHEISQRYNISLKGVPTVGDSLRDLQAGFISGCVPYLVLTGKGEKTKERRPAARHQVFPDLAAVVSHLLKAPGSGATVAFSI